MGNNDSYIKFFTIKSWKDIENFLNKLGEENSRKWIFRGQKLSKWNLETSIERAFYRYCLEISKLEEHPSEDRESFISKRKKTLLSKGIENGYLDDFEDILVKEFWRRLRQFQDYEIDRDHDFIELLATMQHHGAPTRLIDFSYSFFIAFFLLYMQRTKIRSIQLYGVSISRLLATIIINI